MKLLNTSLADQMGVNTCADDCCTKDKPKKRGRKITIDLIRREADKRGYTLKSDEYINAKSKLLFICPSGHDYTTSWDNFNSKKSNCPKCVGGVKLDIEVVKRKAEERGYALLSTTYTNNQTKLSFLCSSGHRYKTKWDVFDRGHGCPTCAKVIKPSLEEIKKEAAKHGCELLSSEYINSRGKLLFLCSCGTEHYTRWEHFRTRFQCKTCAGTEKPTLEQIRETAKKLGYELLEFEYRNNRTGIPVKCRSGHYREVSWSSMKIGRRCLGCYLESLPADVDKKIYRSGVINNIIKRLGKDCCFDVREVSIFLIENLPSEVYDIYNNTPGGCHVDHIIPFNFFDCSRNLSQVLSCWNPANLRYLDASTNISRGNRLALEEIRTFNASQRKIFNDALNKPDKYKNLTLPEDRDGWRAWLSRG